jgi:hypothetical protein
MPVILALTLALYVLGDHSLRFTVSDPLDIDSLHTARVMGDPLRRIGYIALIGGALYAISRMPSLTARPHRGLRRCVVFTVSWMALSVAWSQITALSLKDLGVALIVWLSCAAIGPRLSLAGIRKAAILYNGCAILLGLLCEVLLSTCHPFRALRRNVWNPAPIDSCPAISWRQRDSDSL